MGRVGMLPWRICSQNIRTGEAMSNRPLAAQAQMSMAYPDLVPGETVRWSSRGSWRFGVLVGLDGNHAVVATRESGRRERVLASAVQAWPPAGAAA